MFRRFLLTLCLAFVLPNPSIAATGDWPQWRGPKRDGNSTETGLLKSWPAEGPALLWKATSMGGGYTSPSVANGRIYGAGYRGTNDTIWCLDAKDGSEIWSVAIGNARKNFDYNQGPRSTPTIDGDLLFMLGGAGNMICLQTRDGKEVWRKEYKDDFGGRLMSGWGFAESLLVDGEKLVCTPGSFKGTMVALNKKTGETIWQSTDWKDKSAYSSIMKAGIGGVPQYVQLTDASVAGIDAQNGKLLWRASRPGKVAVIPTPIISGDRVFVTSGYNVGCDLFQVAAKGGQFEVTQVYTNKDMANHHGGVVLIGEHLYGHSDSRGWVCMELKTGEVVWANKGVGKGSVTFADGHLYTRSEGKDGTVALVEATPAGYKEQGRFKQPDRSGRESWPHPVITNGKLLLRDQDVLLCYDVKQK